MKKIVQVTALLLIFFQPVFLVAQNKSDFVGQAGLNATIYRGVEFEKYYFRYNGSPYAYSDDFERGYVVYNDVMYKGVLLNLNAHKDQLHIKIPTTGNVIELDKSLVEDFAIGHRKFMAFTLENPVAGIGEGIYELLYVGKDKLLKKNIKKYNERLQTTEKGIFRYFYSANRYYIIKDGVVMPISGIKHFAKIYKDKKKEIKGFIRKNNVRYIDIADKDIIFSEIMEFVDNN